MRWLNLIANLAIFGMAAEWAIDAEGGAETAIHVVGAFSWLCITAIESHRDFGRRRP